MQKLLFTTIAAFFVLLTSASVWAQTTLVNYDFASAVAGTPCTASPLTTASGVTSTFTTGGTGGGTCTTPAGTAAASPPAFVANAANQAVSLSSFAAGSSNFFQFQLSGVGNFQDYRLFFQSQRSGTGPVNADIQYSTNGTTFTTFQTVNPGNGVFAAFTVDLSTIAAIENQPTVYFRILGSGGTGAAGTFRIDNFQVQATAAPATVAPTITSANNATFTVGQAGTFTVTTTGTPTPTLSFTGTLPAGVTFTDNGNGTATIAGTPAAGTSGSFPITITASNGTSPNATQTFTLTVNPAPTTNTTVVVSPTNLNGFAFAQEVATGTGSFVVGPDTPPLGIGSARLQVDSTGREILFTQQYAGTRLSEITTLQYSTYQNNAGNPDAAQNTISLQFDVDYDLSDGNTAFQGRLVFEPAANGLTVLQNTWQTFDATNGGFYATNAIGTNAGCTQAAPCSRAQLLALFPNVGIRFVAAGAPNNGALILKAGGPVPGGFDGNTDALVIGINGANTTFNFEPENTTAAPAEIAGRVTVGFRGVQKAVVMLSGGDLAEPVSVMTDAMGRYKFEGLSVGETYVVQLVTRRYRFANTTIVVSLEDNVMNADFRAETK